MSTITTVRDLLGSEQIPARTLRLFGVWCARQALSLVGSPDPRSVAACDVTERHANGQATDKELLDAEDDAWAAARDAAWSAAWADSEDDALAAALDAARAAAWSASEDDALAAAEAAAKVAGGDAARAAQIKQLLQMLQGA